MSHHGKDEFKPNPIAHSKSVKDDTDEIKKRLEELTNTNHMASKQLENIQDKVNGLYPDGKLTKDDEGVLMLRIGQENGKIILEFAKPVRWIGFTPEQALQIAEALKNKALETKPQE